MSGLLEKDICLLLKGHRNTMILFLMICVFLGLSQTDTFILGYFPFLMIVLLIGTLSCDEADNGLPFLFTLPIDRKLYIREKYLFCVAGTVVSFVLAWALYLVSLLVHGVSNVSGVLSENAGMIPVFLAVFFITISIMIPVQIKCGPGRNFYCRHRGFADFVPDQCRIYGETGILEKTKDVRFHFKT